MHTLTLYTKPGCHLCEAVEAVIARVAKRRPIQLVVVNILDHPADFERYQFAIPVVSVDGCEIARYRLTVESLDAALDRIEAQNEKDRSP
jgi:glutaredoxin